MEINRRELKARARQAMAAAQPGFRRVTLLFLLLTSGVSIVVSALAPTDADALYGGDFLGLFLGLLVLLYTVVMSIGYKNWSLRVYRGREAGYGSLIDGFSMAGRVLLMEVLIFLRVFGWALLLSIPVGIVMVGAQSIEGIALSALVGYGAMYILLTVIMYRYALAPYLLLDRPELGPGAAVRDSVVLMKGWKWELFKLDLSFLGWYLLNALLGAAVYLAVLVPTLLPMLQQGITPQLVLTIWSGSVLAMVLSTLVQLPLDLWLQPYYEVSRAGFYQARQELEGAKAPPLFQEDTPW